MDVFELRKRLIDDYADYATSFVKVRDRRVRAHVEDELKSGLLWPRPLIQLNPAFESGGTISEHVANGNLHEMCDRIFRSKSTDSDGILVDGGPLHLHKHQADAINAARDGANYVLTTGTGSGKSLTYIIPAVDHVLRTGSGQGIKAIIVYPMNALANSQLGELDKYINLGFPDRKGPVTFARYTGQESDEERRAIISSPPDILITNYVMMELILTRPSEKKLISSAKQLRFLVLDELHTYRGRQGADVALLARRIREACSAGEVLHVGTSATMASTGKRLDAQRAEAASVATQLFGAPVTPGHVIGESLRRATPLRDVSSTEFVAELKHALEGAERPPASFEDFIAHPLSSWIETEVGLDVEKESGRLVRRPPRAVDGEDGAGAALSALTGVDPELTAQQIRGHLLAGYLVVDPATGLRAFAFRLHQFINRGETVYSTLESPEVRYLTTEGQRFVPGDRAKVLFPLAFCRECGHDYYPVWRLEAGDGQFVERDLFERAGEDDAAAGYLVLDPEGSLWSSQPDILVDQLPDDWLESRDGVRALKGKLKERLPRAVQVRADGVEDDAGVQAWFVPAPFRFCLNCGVAYGGRQVSDYAKLATLGSGGRSTATTILSLSVVRALRRDESLQAKARKLLSFTDNRQDASLQAGHFNDFVQTTLLRSALFAAMTSSGGAGVTHDELAQKVFSALALPMQYFAADPKVKFAARTDAERALQQVIGYRLYRDLKRGWRITSPNLEQCGLLRIEYRSLKELCKAEEEWSFKHEALALADPETREKIAAVLLDHMRRELAIKVDYLADGRQDQIRLTSSVQLRAPWAIEEGEKLEVATVIFPRSRKPGDFRGYTYLSSLSGFGQYLRRPGVLTHLDERLSAAETAKVIEDLFSTLNVAGLVEPVVRPSGDDEVPGYQIPASAIIWRDGDGTAGYLDPIRVPRSPEQGRRTNAFFVRLYRTIAQDAKGLIAREHTAQVPSEVREVREHDFREAVLPVLFCSPTMELGVDIAELNAVNLRNVPPTPANYAQRSGRAGRSGQPALVFTYCTTGSPHDQYYFRRQQDMVSGQVAPPKIDLGNEDLVRAHVHAVWLSESGASLGGSLKDVLDVSGEAPSLSLLPSLKAQIEDPGSRARASARAKAVLDAIGAELTSAPWFDDGWLNRVIDGAALEFDRACDRWRTLHRAAQDQRERQNRIIGDASKTKAEKDQAARLRREAEAQLALLTSDSGSGSVQSDFYSYRYFASEGFLPGYSFPRLPISAYIPGLLRSRSEGEFVSRPRFLAVSEFGPRSFIYHEGSRFLVNRVLMPPEQRVEEGGEDLATLDIKQCSGCGYVHRMAGAGGHDLCERCSEELTQTIRGLFRLQNVATIRRDRISSDEEERMRQGYDLRTGIRFARRHGDDAYRVSTVVQDQEGLATLTFGDSAEIWRLNLGWKRRTKNGYHGFVLDTQTGVWARDEVVEPVSDDAPLIGGEVGHSRATVIPYVEDRKNALLVEFAESQRPDVLASLQAALKRAICAVYQLEDSELAAEPLPTRDDRRLLLFYESAEGGAGVLRRLVDDPGELARVAAAALEICHFDTATGEDLRRAPAGRYDCEAACYDCLMSYTNQPDHPLLDRKLLQPLLERLRAAHVETSPVARSREEHLESLKRLTDSALERSWLDYVFSSDLRLPTSGQQVVRECGARPDFYYERDNASIFIDGPHHEERLQSERDETKRRCLSDLGYSVIVFGVDSETWPAVVARYPSVFGIGS